MKEIDMQEMIDFIAEHIDLDKETILEVLELEEDYLYSKGLIEYE